MHRHARHLAARTADRASSQAVMRDRITRRTAALEAAQVAAGVAASEADPALRDLLAMHAGVLDGLPPITPDDDDADAEADADATWLDRHARVGIWQDVMQRARTDITARLIASMLQAAGFVSAGLLARLHQRAVTLHNAIARILQAQLAALVHARMRVAHICAMARAMRAGRSSAATSAAPAHYC